MEIEVEGGFARAHGPAVDDHALALVKAFGLLNSELAAVRLVSAAHPRNELVSVNLRMALDSTLRGLPLKGLSVVPPLQRHSFSYLAEGWAKSIDRQADAVLKAPAARAA